MSLFEEVAGRSLVFTLHMVVAYYNNSKVKRIRKQSVSTYLMFLYSLNYREGLG